MLTLYHMKKYALNVVSNTTFLQACSRIKPLLKDHTGLKILGHFLNVGLLILTAFFVWSTCSEYAAEETDFALTKIPLTNKDNPTVTICFGGRAIIKFNRDFTAKYRYSDGMDTENKK